MKYLPCFLFLFLSSYSANAAILHRTVDFDLNTLNDLGHMMESQSNQTAVNSFIANVGDTIITEINFLSGQSVTFNDGNTSWGYGVEIFNVQYTNSSQPFGATSSFTNTYQVDWETPTGTFTTIGHGASAQGPMHSSFNDISASTFTFTGLTMYTDITSLSGINQFNSFFVRTLVSGDTVIVAPASAVPEPSTYALLVLGCMGLAYSKFRKK